MIIPATINRNYAAPTLIADYMPEVMSVIDHISEEIIDDLQIKSKVGFELFSSNIRFGRMEIPVATAEEFEDGSGNRIYIISINTSMINYLMCTVSRLTAYLYIFTTIAHELRHIWQFENNMYMDDYTCPSSDGYISKYTDLSYEKDAYEYAYTFVNQYDVDSLVDIVHKTVDSFISMQSNIALHLDIHSFLLYTKSVLDHHVYMQLFPNDGSLHDIHFMYHTNGYSSSMEYTNGILVVHYNPMRFITDIGYKRDIQSIARSIATTMCNIFQEAYGANLNINTELYINTTTIQFVQLLYLYFTSRGRSELC